MGSFARGEPPPCDGSPRASTPQRATRTRTDALPALPAVSIARTVTRWIPRRTCVSHQRQSTLPPATTLRRLPSIQTSVRTTAPPRSAAAARTIARRRRRAWRPGEAMATSGAEVSAGGSVTVLVPGGSVMGGFVTGGGGGGGGTGTVAGTTADDALLPAASYASTRYEYVAPAITDVSIQLVWVVVRTRAPSRKIR